jgi:acyl dehydratase
VHDYLDPEHFVVAVAGSGHRMNRLSGDFSPLHTDDEWVRKNTPFSSRIALAP